MLVCISFFSMGFPKSTCWWIVPEETIKYNHCVPFYFSPPLLINSKANRIHGFPEYQYQDCAVCLLISACFPRRLSECLLAHINLLNCPFKTHGEQDQGSEASLLLLCWAQQEWQQLGNQGFQPHTWLSLLCLPADATQTAKANTRQRKKPTNPKQKGSSVISCFLLPENKWLL